MLIKDLLAAAIVDVKKRGDYESSHDFAAAKRATLDLKRELTKLTQYGNADLRNLPL